MNNVKYVRTFEDVIIVFCGLLNHDFFADTNPISAGFISFNDNQCTCYGESFSLKLKSLPEDTKLANRQLFGSIDF